MRMCMNGLNETHIDFISFVSFFKWIGVANNRIINIMPVVYQSPNEWRKEKRTISNVITNFQISLSPEPVPIEMAVVETGPNSN